MVGQWLQNWTRNIIHSKNCIHWSKIPFLEFCCLSTCLGYLEGVMSSFWEFAEIWVVSSERCCVKQPPCGFCRVLWVQHRLWPWKGKRICSVTAFHWQTEHGFQLPRSHSYYSTFFNHCLLQGIWTSELTELFFYVDVITIICNCTSLTLVEFLETNVPLAVYHTTLILLNFLNFRKVHMDTKNTSWALSKLEFGRCKI